MKKYSLTFLLLMLFSLMACDKTSLLPEEPSAIISKSQLIPEARYMRCVMVRDTSEQNFAYYAVHSNDEQLLNLFLDSSAFVLEVNVENDSLLLNFDLSSLDSPEDTSYFDVGDEPAVIVELLASNLTSGVTNFSLKNTSSWLFGYPVGYSTKANFIGVVHSGLGYEFLIQYRYKLHNYSLYYETLTYNGNNAWLIYPSSLYYSSFTIGNLYKRMIVIYPHRFQSYTNYRIAYSVGSFYGQSCTLGSYDNANCLVGIPPSGSTAFIWGEDDDNLNFYYTPLNGNQCPLPGSYFDGANCFVTNIPNACEPFIYNNKWYVKPDLIP